MKFRINLQFIILLISGMIAAVVVTAAVFLNAGKFSFHEVESLITQIIVIVSLVFLLLVAVGMHITNKIVKPVENLSEVIESESVNESYHESKYEELSNLMEKIQKQHQVIVDNADMRQQFTANVTHELKTPLTAITGYSELIENGMVTGDDVRRFAGEIRRNSLRLLTLINDTIRLSELDMVDIEDEFEDVDLFEVADTCVSMLQFSAESALIELKLQGSPAVIRANRVMMEELVYNLCDNAIRYNVKGGQVTVSVKKDEDSVILSVSDTGIGIPKQYQKRIFERFYRVDKSRSKEKGGTGLGLAIVKHIVARHRAEIFVASEEGKGTEIIVIFKK